MRCSRGDVVEVARGRPRSPVPPQSPCLAPFRRASLSRARPGARERPPCALTLGLPSSWSPGRGSAPRGSLRLTGSQHGPCPGPLAVVLRPPQLQRPPFLREAASPCLSCGGSALLPPPSPGPWLAGYLLAPPQSSRASLWLLLRGPLAQGRSHVLRECCRRGGRVTSRPQVGIAQGWGHCTPTKGTPEDPPLVPIGAGQRLHPVGL